MRLKDIFLFLVLLDIASCKYSSNNLSVLQYSSRGILAQRIMNHLLIGYTRLHYIILDFIHDGFAVSVIKSPFVFKIIQ